MQTVRLQMSRQQAKAYLRRLPSLLAGREPDATGGVQQVGLALGLQALTLVREGFLAKSRGGSDEAGDSWEKLKPETIAYSRRHPDKPKGKGPRPLLTADLDKMWRAVFVRTWHGLRAELGDDAAKGVAAGHAWNVVKANGGKTILQEFGSRTVEIGRDTDRLFNSLGPALPGTNPDTVFKVEPGAVAVGTNVQYAPGFHAKRPLWPTPERIPEGWVKRLGETFADAVGVLVKLVLTGAA